MPRVPNCPGPRSLHYVFHCVYRCICACAFILKHFYIQNFENIFVKKVIIVLQHLKKKYAKLGFC